MKFKKLLISASAIAAGSGLLATVLTSCAKANIDKKLRITLDDEGKLYKPGKDSKLTAFTWKDAIKNALVKSTNWGQFKTALADEIVYSWYVDRASTSKSDDKKNSAFRTNLDEWNYQINKDYDNVVQTCKNKYGANWEFYLQNEYLAPNGGTVSAYKHYKLVDKVKADFVSKVFAKSYFGIRTSAESSVYPFTYTPATKNANDKELNNPSNWKKLGFYARTDLSFPFSEDIPKTTTEVKPNWLAKHPEGDYAAIQNYVFDRFFRTEKPFFSDAALFKYSMPTRVAGGKLDQLFNATYTGVKLPEKPNESFPFFGAGDDGSTRKAVNFLDNLGRYQYATKYIDDNGNEQPSNGTITISKEDTDDSQTCLLMYGNSMYGNIYTPYAMAAGNLYKQMLTDDQATITAPNTLTLAEVKANFDTYQESVVDDFAMLSNFFYAKKPTSTVTKYLDLNDVYGGISGGDGTTEATAKEYHCPLFLECKSYPYLYGDTTAEGAYQDADGVWWTNSSGVRYITNNIQVNDFAFSSVSTQVQPWIMELNESGVHIQTIDGYKYIWGSKGDSEANRLERAKEILKYRLMQKQIDNAAGKCISADLLGESGKLKTYFNDNFANIILELAQKTDAGDVKYQVFRSIASYTNATITQTELFLNDVYKKQKLGKDENYATNFINYLNTIISFDDTKKAFTNLESINSKIFSYRSKQITNSKSLEKYSKTIFENGLLAPFVYAPESTIISTRDYTPCNRIAVQDMDTTTLAKGYNKALKDIEDKVEAMATTDGGYVKEVLDNNTVNGTGGFAPQIKTAKSKMSNRFWYNSTIVDKVIHSFMGNKASSANQIKMNAYQFYTSTKDTQKWFTEKFADNSSHTNPAANALATTYMRSKLLSGEKNLSNYVSTLGTYGITNYYTTMNTEFANYLSREQITNGATSDEMLNYELFRATLMYLVGSEKTKDPQDFDNFYTLLNAKISEDEQAIIGYMARDYSDGSMSDQAITDITTSTTPYDFDANVDNMYDKIGYAGGTAADNKDSSKLSTASYWTAINKVFNNTVSTTKPFNGFLGLQTKSSNQLDSGSGLQGAVFDNFAAATKESYNLDKASTKYAQDTGCWFKFAGTKDNNGNLLTWADDAVVYDDGTAVTSCKAEEWFPQNDPTYAPIRKIAKKIIEATTPDDLRTLAKTLASSFDGYSYFRDIGEGRVPFTKLEELKLKMLKVLPSKLGDKYKDAEKKEGFGYAHDTNTFARIKNAEAHTVEVNPRYKFTDTKTKASYRLMLTQINKADVVEHSLTPKWENGTWKQGDNSPITAEEFWVILFNLASESTVQQRVITEIVKNSFGDEKLIVYDAQLYNQFDSVWIKDWSKKTLGA